MLEEEYGSLMPIRFLDPSSVKCYDSNGKEIEIPKCSKCNNYKDELIGKTHFMWICSNGCNE